ncbi:MAG: hypothetical protein FIA94_11945 [Nitrospirae bacterium]|nr:hypothetical protein [Nitrospirota bacterium]
MSWRCPECSRTNEPPQKKCACGYAYYEILGVKEDASPDSTEQTYRYLFNIWKKSADDQDRHARSKAAERLKKINDAHAVFLQMTRDSGKDAMTSSTLKFAAAGGVGLIIFVVIAFVLFSPVRKGPLPSAPEAVPMQQASPEKGAPSLPAQPGQLQPAPLQTRGPSSGDTPDMAAEKTSDWAIESVKKSHSLDRIVTVDALADKWLAENSGKLKPIGWAAKKIGDSIFLVSFTAADGTTSTGFYFDISTETGEIRNIANHPDLQQKYGIRIN